MNFLILIPLAAGIGGDKTMTADEIRSAFVGNTVLTDSPAGTSYDLVHPDGSNVGIHPTQGRFEGSWKISDKGEVCVTWNYKTGNITNCSTVVDQGNNAYKWGDRMLMVKSGDIKNLGK